MSGVSIADILHLPVEERLRLINLIWDSIAAEPDAVRVSPALKAELESRREEFERNPEQGLSWDEVREKVKDGSRRTS